jgi:hypothetical protein
MTGNGNIKLNPNDAAGTFGDTAGKLGGLGGTPNAGEAGVRPGFSGATNAMAADYCGSPEIVEGFLCRFRLGLGFPDLVVDG